MEMELYFAQAARAMRTMSVLAVTVPMKSPARTAVELEGLKSRFYAMVAVIVLSEFCSDKIWTREALIVNRGRWLMYGGISVKGYQRLAKIYNL